MGVLLFQAGSTDRHDSDGKAASRRFEKARDAGRVECDSVANWDIRAQRMWLGIRGWRKLSRLLAISREIQLWWMWMLVARQGCQCHRTTPSPALQLALQLGCKSLRETASSDHVARSRCPEAFVGSIVAKGHSH